VAVGLVWVVMVRVCVMRVCVGGRGERVCVENCVVCVCVCVWERCGRIKCLCVFDRVCHKRFHTACLVCVPFHAHTSRVQILFTGSHTQHQAL
jgi:hypothetical protein